MRAAFTERAHMTERPKGVAKVAGTITLGPNEPIKSMGFGDYEPRPGLVPTPRWANGDVTLPPRQHAYTFGEIMRHDPSQRGLIFEQYHGPKCPAPFCGSRRTKRVEDTQVRQCQVCGKSNIGGKLLPEPEGIK